MCLNFFYSHSSYSVKNPLILLLLLQEFQPVSNPILFKMFEYLVHSSGNVHQHPAISIVYSRTIVEKYLYIQLILAIYMFST